MLFRSQGSRQWIVSLQLKLSLGFNPSSSCVELETQNFLYGLLLGLALGLYPVLPFAGHVYLWWSLPKIYDESAMKKLHNIMFFVVLITIMEGCIEAPLQMAFNVRINNIYAIFRY